jgi:hypothetical protein
MKQQYETQVTVQGKGDSKAKAFADALSKVQQQVLRTSQKILLRIEPLDVRVLRAQESVRKRNFCSFSSRVNGGITAWSWKLPSASL